MTRMTAGKAARLKRERLQRERRERKALAQHAKTATTGKPRLVKP